MKKILILDGVSVGKNRFIEIVKSKYWVWNINDRNILSMVAHKTGWDGIRNKKYYEFLEKQKALVVEYFDYENWYAHDMIQKFERDDRVEVLVMHNCNEGLRKSLEQEYKNCISILVVDKTITTDNHTLVLNCKDEDYDQVILNLLSSLGESEQNAS